MPGTYQVTVKFGGQEAKGTVRVLPDPRSKNTEEDWRRREDALARARAVNDALVEAVERIRQTRADADQVVAKVQSAKKDQEKDSAAGESKPDPLVEAAGKLKGDLDKLERRLWVPYDAVGIQPPTDVLAKLFDAYGGIVFSSQPPSPTHLERLRQVEATAQAVLADFNRFFATDVAAFRKQVEDAKIRLLPEMEPVEVKKP